MYLRPVDTWTLREMWGGGGDIGACIDAKLLKPVSETPAIQSPEVTYPKALRVHVPIKCTLGPESY